MTYPDDADEKQDSIPAQGTAYNDGLLERPWYDEQDECECDVDDSDDSDDSDDCDSTDDELGPGRYTPVHHVSSSLESGAPLYQQQYHSTTYTGAYSDDDDDVSVDGGAPVPPVDILSIADILSNDMDEEYYHQTYPALEHEHLPHDEEDELDDEVPELMEMSAEAATTDQDLVTGAELGALWTAGVVPPPHLHRCRPRWRKRYSSSLISSATETSSKTVRLCGFRDKTRGPQPLSTPT